MTRLTTGAERYDARGAMRGENKGDYRVAYNVAKTEDVAPGSS